MPQTRRQFLVTIRIDAYESEDVEYFINREKGDYDNGDSLDMETLSHENHEVIDWEEIPDVDQG